MRYLMSKIVNGTRYFFVDIVEDKCVWSKKTSNGFVLVDMDSAERCKLRVFDDCDQIEIYGIE